MAKKNLTCPRCGAPALRWDAQHSRWECGRCGWTDRPHGPARLDPILPALFQIPAEGRPAGPVEVSLWVEDRMTGPRRRLDPDDAEAKASIEDRQVIKAILAGVAVLLFLLAVAGWL